MGIQLETHGPVCGIVIFQCNRPLLPIEKRDLIQMTCNVVELGLKRKCSTFLVALNNESSIISARYLMHVRRSYPHLMVYVIVPNEERRLPPEISIRNAVVQLEMHADAILYSQIPIEDFGLNVAIYSDHLVICSLRAETLLDEFLDDLHYVNYPCTIEVMRK